MEKIKATEQRHIDANELRPGNYIYCMKAKNLSTVTNIYGQSGLVDAKEVESGMLYARLSLVLACSPVPLTESLLLKAGFDYDEENDRFKFENDSTDYVIEKQGDWYFIGVYHLKDITYFVWHIYYLHTMQNVIYSLTGTELTLQS